MDSSLFGMELSPCLHASPVNISHVAGKANTLADIASRAIPQFDDDSAFLTHFNNTFPLHGRFWQRASPPPAQLSNVISTLRGQRLTLQRWTVQSVPPTGGGGRSTAPNVELIRGSGTSHPRPAASYCWDLPLGLELDSLGKAGRDPAPRPQVALPVHAIDLAATARNDPGASPREVATAHLIVLAFFFLLRVGEYTLPSEHRTTRTVQFRVCDVRFWQGQTLLPLTSDAAILAAASSVTLTMDNQKNGQRGDIIHQEACDDDFCPVRSVAARVSAIMAQNMPLTTPLSYIQPGIHVQPNHVLYAVRRGARTARLTESGYDLSCIGAHSLRSSGAMALWLSGHSPEAIMKLGRWRMLTFLTYIHAQIAELTAGTSKKMRQPVLFHNVGG
ncbi:hypothetical protein MHU86_728 [Fragilaria crotonensis]|nr:hypothetical protein MHU86_728 [Fragilaria crotonensis]